MRNARRSSVFDLRVFVATTYVSLLTTHMALQVECTRPASDSLDNACMLCDDAYVPQMRQMTSQVECTRPASIF